MRFLVNVCRILSVAPRAGAWIEMYIGNGQGSFHGVAPRAGAWIEILPDVGELMTAVVAPRAGAVLGTELSRDAKVSNQTQIYQNPSYGFSFKCRTEFKCKARLLRTFISTSHKSSPDKL